MRILIITQYFWPESFKVNDLALGLQARGHSVEVLTGMPNYPGGRYFDGYRVTSPTREDYHGIVIHRVPLVPRGTGRAWRMVLNYLSYATLASARLLSLGRRRWDVAIVFGMSPITQVFPAVVLQRLYAVPFVHWVQDLWPESVTASGLVKSSFVIGALRRLSGWLYRSAELVLGSSEAFIPRLRALGVPPNRLGYLPCWAEDAYAAPVETPLKRQPWEGGFAVMFAGNLGRVQALDTVLDAAERLRDGPDVRWVLVGDGSLRPWLEKEVERRQLAGRVFLVGRHPMSAMPALFSKADAMLVSLKPDDIISLTIPAKLHTYLAAGRPVLGSIDGEAARVIAASEAGFVSRAGDAEGLAANVARMQRMSLEERRRMGESGRAYYLRHFDRERCLDLMEASIIRVANPAPGRASSTRTDR